MFIEATDYIKEGDYIISRRALDMSHSESYQNLWVKKYGSISGFPWEKLYGDDGEKYKKDIILKNKKN